MRSTIRATILIPSYNHAAFVVDAVASALAQSERDVEVLVIDDGSTDDSVQRLAALHDSRLTVQSQDNVGLSTTLNRGLARARGRWVKFLPSDDALAADCIARQLAVAEAVSGCGVVFALPEVVDAAGAPLADPAPQAWFDVRADDRDEMLRGLLERNFLCAPGALFARELALAVGGFDPSLLVAQDYDLWLKLLARAPAAMLRERLVRVRWHGANQSAVVTPASEAERARVVVSALQRLGLERWLELFRDAVPAGPAADALARTELAAALRRSGLREVEPFIARLAASPPPPLREQQAPRRGIAAALRGAVARLAPVRSRPAAEIAIAPGPRIEHWIIVDPHPQATVRSRSFGLATALARSGAAVTLATTSAADDELRDAAAAAGVHVVVRGLALLRSLLHDRDERLRLLVQRPDGEVVAFAREARLLGARILYDKVPGWAALARSDVDTERALIDLADDLIGSTRPLVKQLAASRRLVHLLPDSADEVGWQERAASFRALTARPSVTVAVSCAASHDIAVVRSCLDRLRAGRGDLPYRIAAIDDGSATEVLEELLAREEGQELALLRNALRGRASGHNLTLRATASELVVLLDASRGVPGPGWLDPGIAALLERRSLGAVVARDRIGSGSAWTWLAPRAVLNRAAGFDEAYDAGSLEDSDMEQQLRALGYQVAAWSDWAAPTVYGEGRPLPPAQLVRSAERHFRRKWRRPSPSVVLPERVGKV